MRASKLAAFAAAHLLVGVVAVYAVVHAAEQDARATIAARDLPTATALLESLVAQDPCNANAHLMLGAAYRTSGADLRKAFDHFRIALAITPANPAAHVRMAEAYLADRNPEAAERHLAEVERICRGRGCRDYLELEQSILAYWARKGIE